MKSRGQNLTEFAIIMALVVIVCVAILTVFGDTIKNLISGSKTKVENFKPFNVTYNKDTGRRTITKGELGGTVANPVTQCNQGLCDVDYGDFVLNGIPENFGSFVESSGTSGGTETLISALEEIADQMEATNGPGAAKLRALANYGHIISDIQKAAETKAKACGTDTNCLKSWVQSKSDTTYTLPSQYQSLLPDFDLGGNNRNVADLLCYTYIAQARVGYPPDAPVADQSYPGSAAILAYDNIKDDTSIPQSIRDITKELYSNLNNLSMNLYGLASASVNPAVELGGIDPFTGAFGTTKTYPLTNPTSLVNPKIGAQTNVTSAVICATGRNKDNGYKCN